MVNKVTRPRDVRVIALARLISEAGDEIALIALLFQVKSSGPAAISAIFALYALSRILLAPYSGSVADRFSTKRLIITVSLAQTAVAICLAFSHGAVLYVLVFLLALGATITCRDKPARICAKIINRDVKINTINNYEDIEGLEI